SWVVKFNSGAGPILGKLSRSPAAQLSVDANPPATASTMSSLMPHPCRTCTPLPSHHGGFSSVPRSPYPRPTLPLQCLLELLEKAPVGALGNDLLRAALEHHSFVEA